MAQSKSGFSGDATYVATIADLSYPIVAVGRTEQEARHAAARMLLDSEPSWLACEATEEAVADYYGIQSYGPIPMPGAVWDAAAVLR